MASYATEGLRTLMREKAVLAEKRPRLMALLSAGETGLAYLQEKQAPAREKADKRYTTEEWMLDALRAYANGNADPARRELIRQSVTIADQILSRQSKSAIIEALGLQTYIGTLRRDKQALTEARVELVDLGLATSAEALHGAITAIRGTWPLNDMFRELHMIQRNEANSDFEQYCAGRANAQIVDNIRGDYTRSTIESLRNALDLV